MFKRSLRVVPEPKEIQWGRGGFALNAGTQIVLLPDAGEREHDSARSLQREVLAETGLRLPIVKTAHPVRDDNIVLLISDWAAAKAFMGALVSVPEALGAHGEQAYLVDISPERVVAGGEGADALHYAVQTLRQITRLEGAQWLGMLILDWPTLPHRGLMLDVSRGRVPSLETLKRLVDELSLFKGNVLQLYTEHTFAFPHHPRIGAQCGSLSGDDMLALDAYARSRGVELMPNLQSFGHCAHILNMPEYEHLAESAARWSLCPTDERTYEFLDDLYGDLLPSFASTTLNVGCDETYDLGKGRSKGATAEMGTGRLYLQHIQHLYELAKGHGRRIQLWGDILLHYPELVPELPEDVTLLDWHYGAAEDYPSVRVFAESGRPFWVCPGTSSWNTLFPSIENANANIRTLARLGAEHGAVGLLNTDWGDWGHYQPIGQSWYAYVYGLEQAWTGGQTDDEAFDPRFGALFFGAGGEQVVAAMRALARLNTLPGMVRSTASNSVYALLDEPLVGEMIEQIPAKTLEKMGVVCAEAEQTLRASIASSRDPLSIEEMIYSMRMMAYAARKLLASQGIRADLEDLSRGRGDADAVLGQAIGTFRALELDLLEHSEVFRTLWLRRGPHAEIGITWGYFEQLQKRFGIARAWLAARLDQAESGETPSYDLGSYKDDAKGYEILGQAYRRRMHEAGAFSD